MIRVSALRSTRNWSVESPSVLADGRCSRLPRRFLFASPACGARRVSPPACVGLGVRGLAASATSIAFRVAAMRERGLFLYAIAQHFGVDDHTAAKALRWFWSRRAG